MNISVTEIFGVSPGSVGQACSPIEDAEIQNICVCRRTGQGSQMVLGTKSDVRSRSQCGERGVVYDRVQNFGGMKERR